MNRITTTPHGVVVGVLSSTGPRNLTEIKPPVKFPQPAKLRGSFHSPGRTARDIPGHKHRGPARRSRSGRSSGGRSGAQRERGELRPPRPSSPCATRRGARWETQAGAAEFPWKKAAPKARRDYISHSAPRGPLAQPRSRCLPGNRVYAEQLPRGRPGPADYISHRPPRSPPLRPRGRHFVSPHKLRWRRRGEAEGCRLR